MELIAYKVLLHIASLRREHDTFGKIEQTYYITLGDLMTIIRV
jgi:hypothetical protein